MDNLEEHKAEFERIVKEYQLFSSQKADDISKYITSGKVDLEEFSSKFNIEIGDAKIFLDFIQKGIQFKEKHLDKK